MDKIVVDSNVLIRYLLKDEAVTYHLENLINKNFSIYVPAIVFAEMMSYPKLTESERMTIKSFVNNFYFIPIDFSIAELGGFLRSKYKIKLPDALIAATSIYLDAELFTFNLRDFKKIKELRLYKF